MFCRSYDKRNVILPDLPQEARSQETCEPRTHTPAAPNTPAPAVPNALHVNLVQNIERLKLDVVSILPLHGRIVPLSELYAAIGKKL